MRFFHLAERGAAGQLFERAAKSAGGPARARRR